MGKSLKSRSKIALVLSGGGARGAYQTGVVKAVAEIARDLEIANPIDILTGVSAGAVNVTYLAAKSDRLDDAADGLAQVWRELTADRVFHTDLLTSSWLGAKFFTDATVGAFYRKKFARSLLDTSPLRKFLAKTIAFEKIGPHIRAGHFDSLAVTAMNYTNSTSTTFVQADSKASMWLRSRRRSVAACIDVEHVMASSAIPLFFPPVPIGGDHYGDGCLRNTAPLSPAIHLGAKKILVVSVNKAPAQAKADEMGIDPSVARVLGVMMNALLLDAIDVDMERMERVNLTVPLIPDNTKDFSLKKIESLWIRPSENVGELAFDMTHRLPRVLRYLLAGLGSSREAAELTSYLLFDPQFCGKLVEIGFRDGMASREAIERFLTEP